MLINAIDLLGQSNPGVNGQAPGDLAGLFAGLLQTALGDTASDEQNALIARLDELSETSDADSSIGDLLANLGDQRADLEGLLQLLAAQAPTTAPASPTANAAFLASEAAAAATIPTSQSPDSAAGDKAASTAAPAPNGSAAAAGADQVLAATTAAGASDDPLAAQPAVNRAAATPNPAQSQGDSVQSGPTASGGNVSGQASGQTSGTGPAPAAPAASARAEAADQQRATVQDGSLPDEAEVAVSNRQRQSAPASPLSSQVTAAILTSSDQATTQVSGQAAAGQQAAAQRDPRARSTDTGPLENAEPKSKGPAQGGAGAQTAAPGATGAAGLPEASTQPTASAQIAAESVPGVAGGEPTTNHHGQAGLQPGSGSIAGPAATDAATQSDQAKSQAQFAKPTEQIAMQINRSLGEGRDRVTVHLEPAELGRIEVKLDLAKDGTLRAMIVADKPDTLDLLQRDSRALERALQDAGLKTGSNSLSFNLRGEGQGEQLARQRDASGGDAAPLSQLNDESLSSSDSTPKRSAHRGSLDISV